MPRPPPLRRANRARRLLGEPFSFVGWFDRFDEPDACIEALRKLHGFIVTIDVHKVFVDDEDVCVLHGAVPDAGAGGDVISIGAALVASVARWVIDDVVQPYLGMGPTLLLSFVCTTVIFFVARR